MTGALSYARWARELRMSDWVLTRQDGRAERLSRSHGTALRLLADYADSDGRCEVGVKTLARTLEWSREYTHRLLNDLERVGLVATVRRGGGRRCAVRQLRVDVQPATQLQLGVETPPTGPECVTSETVTSNCDRDLGNVTCVTSGGHKKEREGKEEGAHATIDDPTGALAPKLSAVCTILAAAPGVDVLDPPLDPAVNHTLLALPEAKGYDHEQAAHTVASWAHEGGLWSRSAPRLLHRALLKQTADGRREANRIPRSAAPRPMRGAGHGSIVARGDELLAALVNGRGAA